MPALRWVAAASVIILIGLAMYRWMLPQSNETNNNNIVVKNDAAPGRDKAVLQLADGKTINIR